MNANNSKAITPEQVDYIANLSRVELREGDRERFTVELNEILGYVNTLSKLDTDGIDPTFQTAPLFNVMRKDESEKGLDQDQVFKNAPDREGSLFKAPPVIGSEK